MAVRPSQEPRAELGAQRAPGPLGDSGDGQKVGTLGWLPSPAGPFPRQGRGPGALGQARGGQGSGHGCPLCRHPLTARMGRAVFLCASQEATCSPSLPRWEGPDGQMVQERGTDPPASPGLTCALWARTQRLSHRESSRHSHMAGRVLGAGPPGLPPPEAPSR